MLKIKDDVPFKKLKEFGFEKNWRVGFDRPKVTIYINDEKIIKIVSPDECWWDKEFYYNYENDYDIVYDLIQAGLVEKVEG
jgi:hypothetical protein